MNFLKKNLNLIVFIGAIILFVLFTVLLKVVDVKGSVELGINGKVGFSSLNFAVIKALGTPNQRYASYANALIIVAVLPIIIMALVACGQILKNRHVFTADAIMYGVLVMGIVLLALYFIFDKALIINTRPFDDKSSYPSSHVAFAIYSLACSWYFFSRFMPKSWMKIVSLVICVAFIVAISVCKILCAEHYVTDVIGSYLLAFMLVSGALFFEKVFAHLQDITVYKGIGRYNPEDAED